MIIYGKNCVLYTLENAPHRILEVYLSKDIDKALFKRIARLNVPILRLDNKKAQALSKGRNHQGIFVKITPLQLLSVASMLELPSLIVLCGLSDVGNIGAIARSAYGFGVGGLVICDMQPSNDALQGIVRSSSGAALQLPIGHIKSSLELINQAKMRGFHLIAADSNASSGGDLSLLSEKWALFVGREDVGLSKKILAKMEHKIHIKMKNNFNSLNVSAATAVIIDRIFDRRV